MNTPRDKARPSTSSADQALGHLLKEWRSRRGVSQLDLALAARTTQRHVSFIETGRAVPSREMVLRLAATLGLPLRQQNAVLLAAGYAPAWRERGLSAPGMEVVDRALDHMLAQHEPFPAFVVDRRWNLLRVNRGATKFVEFLTGPAPVVPDAEPVNLAVALIVAGRAAASDRQLGGGRRSFPARRAKRCGYGRHAGNHGVVPPPVGFGGGAIAVGSVAARRKLIAGSGDSLSARRYLPASVHDNRNAWYPA